MSFEQVKNIPSVLAVKNIGEQEEECVRDLKILKTKVCITDEGLHIELTTDDGSTYRLDDIDDGYLINTLKNKGYKISREF